MTESSRRKNRSPASSLVLLAWALAFFALGGTTLLSLHPIARAIGVLLFGVPVMTWAIRRWRRRPDRLDAAVLLGVLAHVIVSFASLDPHASLETSAAAVAYAAVYGVARETAGDPLVRRALTAAIVAALLFWLVVLAVTWIAEKLVQLQQLGSAVPIDAHQPWVWGSINTAPALTLLVGPFIAWLPRSRMRGVATAIWAATAIVVVPLSMGRAGWLGIAVAALAAEVVIGFPLLRRVGMTARVAGRVALAAGGGVLVVIIAAWAFGRLSPITTALDTRARLWDQAIAVFAADPLTGAGPSTFGWARLAHIPDYVHRVAARDAHSVPLQTLADGGLFLFAAWVLIGLAWASLVVERRPALHGRQRLAIATLVGYAAFALLDDLSFLPTITVLIIVLAAWAIPSGPGISSPRRSAPAATVPTVLLIAGMISAPALLAMTGSRLAAASGRDAAVRADWRAAVTAFERAAALQPRNAQLWMSIGLSAANADQPDRAAAAYERAVQLSPGDPRPWGALATLETDDAAAIRLLDAAARRSNDPRYAYRLADLHLREGDRDAAADAYALSVTLWPDWWAVVPESVRANVVRVLGPTIARVGPVGTHDPREAAWNAGLLFDRLPNEAAPPWHAVDAASRSDFDEAAAHLEGAPPSVRADQAARAVALLACDRPAYERALQRLDHREPEVHPGDHPVRVGRSGLYRDQELGDYQPILGRSVPEAPPWPLGLIEVPDCGW